MNTTPLAIPDVILIEPKVFGDDRGFFFESFNQEKFEAAIGRQVAFVQDNHSRSALHGFPTEDKRVNDVGGDARL